MGLRIDIYRDDYDSPANVFYGKRRLTLVDFDGPFDPTDDAPAAFLDRGPYGDPKIVPVAAPADRPAGPTFGGTFGYSSDSRFGQGVAKLSGQRTGRIGFFAAVPIFDRFDTWSDFDALTR